MRISLIFVLFMSVSALHASFISHLFSDNKPNVKCDYSGTDGHCVEPILKTGHDLVITVTGQGVAPSVTASPAQAYALAKRAAMVDGYRLIAEKVKGVQVEGQDTIKNMMLQQSTTKTSVEALVRGANVMNTTFKEGLCEVEMEISLSYSRVSQ